MEDSEQPVGFAFGIRPRFSIDGSVEGYAVFSENHGVPEEFIVTLMRNWLRERDDVYFERFKSS